VVGDRADFFVSHAGADRAWAEWVAWQLTDAGYTVELDVWDWATGQNLVLAMSDAVGRCDRVVALFSAAYFNRAVIGLFIWARIDDQRQRSFVTGYPGRTPGFQDHEDIRGSMHAGSVSEWPTAARRRFRGGYHGA